MQSPTLATSAEVDSEHPTLETILAEVGDVEKAIYHLVRSRLDTLEKAAPWDLLYFLPDNPKALLTVLSSLLETVEEIPVEVSKLLKGLGNLPESDGEILEEIAFFFAGVHEMASHDLGRLHERLTPFLDEVSFPRLEQQTELCEIAADLKGKYASAMMGVAASILGREMGHRLDLEEILFPEKAEEFTRNEMLLEELSGVVTSMQELTEDVPFPDFLERWRHHLRVEEYALADLSILRGRLRRLLQQRHRRALYSGDYQRIKTREAELNYRLVAMEDLHQLTWKGTAKKKDLEGTFSQLVQIVLEVAAILDTNILKSILGEEAVANLRQTTSEEIEIARGHLPDTERRQAVAAFLAEEDLKTFLDFLYGVVRKRSSFAREQERESSETTEEEKASLFDLEILADSSPMAVDLPTPASGQAEGSSGTSEKLGPPPLVPSRRGGPPALENLERMLGDICSPNNPRWNSFRMVHRLVDKHARVPPSMVLGAAPFLEELKSRIAPQLEELGGASELGQTVVHHLQAALLSLRTSRLLPGQSEEESATALKRVNETVEALQKLLLRYGESSP